MKSKPWIAHYHREYRTLRKWGRSKSVARRLAGKSASDWWTYIKQHDTERL